MTAPILQLPVKVLRSATAGRRPGDGTFRALTDGELFVNTQDRVVCYLSASGTLLTVPFDPALFTALAPLASPAFTGTPTAPTPAAGDSSTALATTAFAAALAALLAPKASPALTGAPTAPTQAAKDASTKLATTAYADAAVAALLAAVSARTPVADKTYTILSTDRTVAVTSLSAARALTLPTAASYPTGTQLLVVDESGSCSGTNTVTIGVPAVASGQAADTINGAASYALAASRAYVTLESNGAGAWTVVDSSALAASNLSSASPTMAGAAAAGTSAQAAHSDHVHPIDTSRAPIASPAFTGTATFAARPTFNGATPWDSANFTPSSKIGGDNVTTVGYNSGSQGRPYVTGGPGYRDLVWTYEYFQAIGSAYGTRPYFMSADQSSRQYLQRTNGANDHLQSWNGSNLIWQVDGNTFTVATSSDARLKIVEGAITDSEALGLTMALQPVAFMYDPAKMEVTQGQAGRRLGFLAQDLAHILPGAVIDGVPDANGNSYNLLSQDAAIQFCAVLMKTCQNLADRVFALEKKL